MSKMSDIRRAMRPAQMQPKEERALKVAIERAIRSVVAKGETSFNCEVPGITWAGNAYLLTLDVRGGRIFRFEVDHDPDLSAPSFEAYVAKRAEWEREQKADKANS